ncbi:hypothetical protein Nepgr_000239 [Nepenthes gracilis]|uniref:Core-2/I-branching beta-1,6-N-acetylglucosaminyltransferase family protein n=1 Tax=Nepenthes gracilis TaxID=150966 RepID=A0AAD3RWJ0_NEPGR|nr:hypothetical protein Nepgr_000239 [Nepenthes gracilis]
MPHSHLHSLGSQMFQSRFVLIFSLLLSLPLLFLLAPRILTPRQGPIPLPDELDDLALFNRAVAINLRSPSNLKSTFFRLGSTNPKLKIAFMFLINTDLYFAPLWERFFNNGSKDLYNIYIHADPSLNVNDPGGVFKDRFIPSKHTERSSPTLISAARRLLATAILDDSLNFYFALISQSCIPIHSFAYVYQLLFNTRNSSWGAIKYRSFIEILSNESILYDRYNARGKNVMMPEVPFSEFRVGSQFFVLTKKHALLVLKDRKLWRKFRLPCIRVQSCYPEEHYFPTLLSMEDLKGCTGFTLTRVNWTDSVNGHPHTYRPPEVSPQLIYKLRQSNFSNDHLFARKFSPDCLSLLMDMADGVIFKD